MIRQINEDGHQMGYESSSEIGHVWHAYHSMMALGIFSKTMFFIFVLAQQFADKSTCVNFRLFFIFVFLPFVIVKWQSFFRKTTSTCESEYAAFLTGRENTQNSSRHSPFAMIYHHLDSYGKQRKKEEKKKKLSTIAVYRHWSDPSILVRSVTFVVCFRQG
jgi:hypothetical protein